MKNLVGSVFGQYEIIAKIGQGGMAHVFKARQLNLDRFVALKILSPTLAEQPGFAERFQREAHAAARLHHPNILQVYDYGVEDKYNYIVMRYVEGSKTLSDLILENPPLDQVVDYIVQIADALAYAHERGIVHRDVKPGNVLIDGRWAYLSDFGLVKLAESSSHLTGTGVSIGTPAYMSPEQVNGSGAVDHRTDIYALGIILYKILTGTVPHDAQTPIAVLVKRSTEPVPPINLVKPSVPRSLQEVTMRSLAMEPDARFRSATDFAEALKKAKTESHNLERTITDVEGITLPSGIKTPLPQKIEQSQAKSKWPLFAGLGLVVMVLLGAVIFWVMSMLGNGEGELTQLSTPTANRDDDGAIVASLSTATATSAPATATATAVAASPAATMKIRQEVRRGPGQVYELMGYLPEGAVAQIVSRDESGQWWQITTTLTETGLGWIPADPAAIEASNITNLPIALAPPTPTVAVAEAEATPTATSTATPTATATAPPATPTTEPSPSPTPSPTEAAPGSTAAVASTSRPLASPTLPAGQLTLLTPNSLDEPSFGPTQFEWQWSSPLAENQGFEVRVWREGEPPAGAHDAVLDNKNGTVQALGNNRYRLNVDISEAFGVKGRGGDYNWTVVLVQIEPEYQDLGIQAPTGQLRYAAPGGGGGGDGGGGGGGGGGGSSL